MCHMLSGRELRVCLVEDIEEKECVLHCLPCVSITPFLVAFGRGNSPSLMLSIEGRFCPPGLVARCGSICWITVYVMWAMWLIVDINDEPPCFFTSTKPSSWYLEGVSWIFAPKNMHRSLGAKVHQDCTKFGVSLCSLFLITSWCIRPLLLST